MAALLCPSSIFFSGRIRHQEGVEEGSLSPSQLQSLSKSPRPTYEHLRPGRERGRYFFHFCTIAQERLPVIFQTSGVPLLLPALAFTLFGVWWLSLPVASILGGHTLPDSHSEVVPSGVVVFLTPSLWAPLRIVPILTHGS